MPVRSSRAGFTAPELLNMVVVGAILAAIIYGQRRPPAGPAVDPQIAPMRAALLELKQAQESFRGRTGHYTAHVDSLQVAPAAGMTREIDRADTAAWHGRVTREGAASHCELAVGGGAAADTVVCRPGGA